MTGHDCATCTIATCNSRGTTVGKVPSDSIVQELQEEHHVMWAIVPCPCRSGSIKPPDPDCPGCSGTGELMYAIEEVRFR